VNNRERNCGNFGNFGNYSNYSNFATLASFPSESGPSDLRPPDYCLGWPGLGTESLDSEWFWDS
jgi:hypothetical protein